MKKIQFIIILTITVLLSGCTVEKNDLKNGKGASAAAYWLDATEEVLMRCPDVAFKFNTWLNAPDDQKDSIKNLYFPNYEIQERPDNRWFFYLNGRRIFGINTHGDYTLNRPNVSWQIGWDTMAYSSTPFHTTYLNSCSMSLSRLNGSDTWTIHAQPMWAEHPDYFPWFTMLELTFPDNSVPASLTGQDFTLAGEGAYHFLAKRDHDKETYYCQLFTIKDAQIRDFKGMDIHNLWASGDLTLKIIADWDTVPENCVAEENLKALFYTKGGKQNATIIMHDVEEEWTLPEPQNMEQNFHEASFIEWFLPWF